MTRAMNSLPKILLLLVVAAATPCPAKDATARRTRHHAVNGDDGPPSIRLTIINATSVPEISLSKGTNIPADYPRFRQGTWTADEALTNSTINLVVRTSEGVIVANRSLVLPKKCHRFLLLSGDLSRRSLAEKPTQPLPRTASTPDLPPPNLQFLSYPVELVTKDPFHYRVVNAMPDKTLTLHVPAHDGKPARTLGILTPGNSLLFTGHPPSIEWIAEIDGAKFPVSVTQEGAAGNCLIPFFLRKGRPDFVRIFENP
jgi:hypothetical protein